jgi:hypothetical protein
MITNGHLTSLQVLNQLPEHVRDNPDYVNFHEFVQAYYEWMEQTGKVTERSKNLLSYKDIDKTIDEFLDYFTNDFLPYFPKDSLLSKQEAVKVARQLYQSKGTPASYEFLFRVLYNSSVDIFYTKDAIFKASAGSWYIAKSLKLLSNNTNFLNTKNYRIFGEESKSIATIENAIVVGDKIEVFISNIERLFQSGEFVRIVDSNNQDVLFDGSVLRSKIVGQISQIKIAPTNRGQLYQPGDPIIVYDGLNANVPFPVGATAIVGETTKGSIQRINVVNGGFGYSTKPNTIINITGAPGAKANVGSISPYLPPSFTIVNGGKGYKINDPVIYAEAAFAYVSSVDANGTITNISYSTTVNARAIVGITASVQSSNNLASNAIIRTASSVGNAVANVSYIPTDIIGFKKNITIGNTQYNFAKTITANANTRLINAFSFTSFSTYPISSVVVENGGGGIAQLPDAQAVSTYRTDDSTDLYFASYGDLATLGMLGPIQISKSGVGYRANDRITITGGTGRGAYANVTSVDANGAITGAEYAFDPAYAYPLYPLGGMGYTNKYIPGLTIQSANTQASGAELFVPGILGTGATFSLVVDRVGSITTVNILNYGQDYESKPKISLKVQDVVVSNVSIGNLPRKGDVIYQGPSINLATYKATVNSVSRLSTDANSELSLFNLRVFNYNSNPNPNLILKVDERKINFKMGNSAYPQFAQTYNYYDALGNQTVYKREYNQYGVLNYGDGSAKANATFLNGLVIGDGQYLTTQGQPSSYDVIQSSKYNNFTYQITLEKEIAKYKDVLLNLLHPSGTKVLGRYALKSNNKMFYHPQEGLYGGKTLSYYFGEHVPDVLTINTSFTNKSNNIIKFNNTLGANLETFIFPNQTTIEIASDRGTSIKSLVTKVNNAANTITIASNVWLTFGNVAVVNGTSGTNTLNITSLTGQFDYENNGVYSNTSYPLKDIVYSGDSIQVNSNTYTVKTVNYLTNNIVLTTNLTANENTLLSVNRKFIANTTILSNQIKILGPIGLQYIPEITTEGGGSLSTEDGRTILLG